MSEKKKKALERELLDDLLDGQTDAIKPPFESDEISSIGAPPSLPEDAAPDFGQGYSSSAPKEHPLSASKHDDESTVKLPQDTALLESQAVIEEEDVPQGRRRDDEVRASVGRFGNLRSNGSPTGNSLAHSENLRIAQGRITELEQEVERLRVENEDLASAGETFRRKADELTSKTEDLENRYTNAVDTHTQEKQLLLATKESLRHELDQLKAKNEELELRISTNIQKIRVRERELENRLELVKMEGAALIRSKDELILDLKRQMDQLNLELNNYRTKSQELNRAILDKQDILRRTVKALRLALTMLEGEEESAQPVKRAK